MNSPIHSKRGMASPYRFLRAIALWPVAAFMWLVFWLLNQGEASADAGPGFALAVGNVTLVLWAMLLLAWSFQWLRHFRSWPVRARAFSAACLALVVVGVGGIVAFQLATFFRVRS